MLKNLPTITLTIVLAASLAAGELRAQSQPKPQPQDTSQPSKPGARPGIPLQVQVVVSRFRGEKKVSSVPYTLSVNAASGRPSQLRVGAEVPIPTMAKPTIGGKPLNDIPVGGPVQYRPLGTNIDCSAIVTEDDRFQVSLTIEDSSIYVDGQAVEGVPKAGEPPIIRSFRFSNEFTLRSGQSTQFTAATDRIVGEVIRVDVTVNVVK